MVSLLQGHRLLLWLKARQIGASWVVVAYIAWMMLYQQGTKIAMISKGQVEAQELLDKVRFIFKHLPDDMRPVTGTNNTEVIEIPSLDSKVRAYPSTLDAGIGDTFSIIVMDEADSHPHFGQSYDAIKPTTDDIGGQMVILSTPDPNTIVSPFKDMVRAAPGNGFVKIYYPWYVRPDRDQAWWDKGYNEAKDKARYLKAYSSSEAEALAPPETLLAFEVAALQGMELDVREPIEQRGPAKIWQKYQVGRKYGAGTDTSHGVGSDEAVTIVMDMGTGMVVARIKSNVIEPTMLAFDSVALLAEYKYPLWAIEDNDRGHETINAAKGLEYPNLYYRQPPKPLGKNAAGGLSHAQEGKVGWHTDEITRYILWGELMDAIQSRLIIIPDKEGLAQFWEVIRNPKRAGRIEAIEGGHDDYPMAMGLAWQMRKYARSSGVPRQSGRVKLRKEF
jgi:hypothetical protein